MKSYFGKFVQLSGHEPVDATVLLFDKNLNIGFKAVNGSNAMVNWLMKDVAAKFDTATSSTIVTHQLTPQVQLTIPGDDAMKHISAVQNEQQRPWHQKSSGREWIRNSLLVLGILAVLFLLYLLIVPWLSQKLAATISVSTEQKLGNAIYNGMGLADREDKAKTLVINDFFASMNISTAYNVQISVVNDATVNAFAIPGGHIVVYTGLLDELKTYPELAALLSHEFTHVNNKHSTKRIFRQLGSKVFIALLFGKFGTVTSVLVDHADHLKSLKYSRALEKEADMNGLRLLKERNIDPNGFVRLFEHLKTAGDGQNLPEFLASHPDLEKRIAYVKEASQGMAVGQDEELKAIFEKLKSK